MAVVLPRAASATTPPPAYYVDCNGSNTADGSSPATAWQTLGKANKATLGPGQELLLKRGCTWNGQRLNAAWTGQPGDPVFIGAYGVGPDPVIENGASEEVKISGTYEVVDGLMATVTPTQFTSCGEPIGNSYGFNFVPGAKNDTVQNSTATAEMAGIHLAFGADDNAVLDNVLDGNNMVTGFHTNPANDLGAWGILVDSSNNDIAFNLMENNVAVCSNQGYQLQSNSVELYTAQGNSIHDNISLNDRVFSELGSSATVKSSGNTYAYNLFDTGQPNSRFITTRGAGDTRYGPVDSTYLVHNSTYQTGAGSTGISCVLGCGSAILQTDSNIIWADGWGVRADAAFPSTKDLFWSDSGAPVIKPDPIPGAIIANPLFVDPAGGNLRLQSGSPAVAGGDIVAGYTVDAYGTPLPAGPGSDSIGAAQYASVTAG